MKHHGKTIDTAGDFKVIDCVECGFKHILPVPDEAELERLYSLQYHVNEKPTMFQRIEEDLPWWYMVYKECYEFLEGYMPWYRRRLLDIGSGVGYFLKMGMERGWFTTGIEPSKQAVDYSTKIGCNVVEGFFQDKLFNDYDVVHMHEVLEHLRDPLDTLKTVYKALAKDGLVYVVVPNDYNVLQKALKRESYWVSVPWHINYFDKESLQALMENAGFKVIHYETTFPMEVFLFMGLDYVGNDEIGRKCHRKRMELEMTMPQKIRLDFYKKLGELGIGREIIMIGKKL